MAGQVSVDDAAYEKAVQIKSHLSNSVHPSLNQLKNYSGQLSANPNFKGNHADQYRKAHQDMVNAAAKFQQGCDELNQSVTKLIQSVGTAGGNTY